MISIKRISISELPNVILNSYKGDADLLNTQHVFPFEDVESAVDCTFGMIQQMAAEKKLNIYKVICQKKGIGYFVTFDNYLFSFCINIKYRNRDVLTGWWQQVKKSLDKNFLCILYPHQSRAQKFLRKNGMIMLEFDKENNAVILQHHNIKNNKNDSAYQDARNVRSRQDSVLE
jgi:hypothetical protein